MQDVRFALRQLYRSPGFTLVAVTALALGIGANTAIFSVVNSMLLRPLPYRAADRLMNLYETEPGRGWTYLPTSGRMFQQWRDQATSFEDMAAMERGSTTVTGLGEPEQLPRMRVTLNYFRVLGVQALLGQTFHAGDGHGDSHNVMVMTHEYWMRRFGGDRSAVNRTIVLDGLPYIVIGVLPAGFWSPIPADVFVPLPKEELRSNLSVLALLKPGVSIEQARAELRTIQSRLAGADPVRSLRSNGVEPLQHIVVRSVRPALLVLLAAVGFVLLIACANVANLLLARGARREREIAIRTAIGASRRRIAWQMFAECLVLGGLGGVAGLIAALWGVDLLDRIMPMNIGVARAEWMRMHISIDGWVLAFTAAMSIATSLLFGLAPAIAAASPDLNGILKETGRGVSPAKRSLRDLLVAAEIALAFALLVCAAIAIKSFVRMRQADLGFRPQSVLTMEMELPIDSKYRTGVEQAAFYRALLERAAHAPGIKAAGITNVLPLDEDSLSFAVEREPLSADGSSVSSGYFDAVGIPLLRGRFFSEFDTPAAPLAAIVDEPLVRRYLPLGRDAVGQKLRIGDRVFTVIGVVGGVKHSGLESEAKPAVYLHYQQWPDAHVYLAVRTALGPSATVRTVKRVLSSLDAELPVFHVRTMDELIDSESASRRTTLVLLATFALTALGLASLGIYGVMSYTVGQRTHEIGIRMAMGAQKGAVLRLVIGHGMLWASAGVLAGLLLAIASTRLLRSMLSGVGPPDPGLIAGCSGLLLAVALAACYLPARRAAKVDPVVSLRYQ